MTLLNLCHAMVSRRQWPRPYVDGGLPYAAASRFLHHLKHGEQESVPLPVQVRGLCYAAVMTMTFVEAEALSTRIVGMYAPDRLANRWGEVIRAFPHRPKGSSQWRVRYHIEYPSGVPAWGEVENPSILTTLQSRPDGMQNDA